MNNKIFIVEDESDILELVKLILKNAGYQTEGFNGAKLMLNRLTEQIPDLIILDLMLPDLDGMEACRIIKNRPEWETIPIIMLTARTDVEDRVRGLEYGADDYITKPFASSE